MTVITFIGLFVFMSRDVGYNVAMPNFQGHDTFIAWQQGGRDGGTWGPVKTIPNTNWEYVDVQKQKITFQNVPGSAPAALSVPHLSCCCTALRPTKDGGKGLQKAYTDGDFPSTQKKGAQVEMPQGTAKQILGGLGDRMQTQFEVNAPNGITIIGTNGQGQGSGSSKTIIFKPGAQIIFADSPFCAVFDPRSCPKHIDAEPDFTMYYSMAVDPNSCQASPSSCSQCKQNSTSCPASPCSQKRRKVGKTFVMVTVDCSNSQWP